MDKRWIGILLILIAGLSCMYVIVDNSNSVGNAITVISDVSIVVPPGLKINDGNSNDVTLLNKQTNESIYIECIDKNPKKEFHNEITEFKNKNNVKMTNSSNSTLERVDFVNIDTGQNTSFILFKKAKHTFIMKMDKYHDMKQQDKEMMFVIDNLKPDYKQNKG